MRFLMPLIAFAITCGYTRFVYYLFSFTMLKPIFWQATIVITVIPVFVIILNTLLKLLDKLTKK